jgi:hypothetical protein
MNQSDTDTSVCCAPFWLIVSWPTGPKATKPKDIESAIEAAKGGE